MRISSYTTLERMTNDELLDEFNETASRHRFDPEFMRYELALRENARILNETLTAVKQLRVLAVIFMILTIYGLFY